MTGTSFLLDADRLTPAYHNPAYDFRSVMKSILFSALLSLGVAITPEVPLPAVKDFPMNRLARRTAASIARRM
jgi:hypothetical protein